MRRMLAVVVALGVGLAVGCSEGNSNSSAVDSATTTTTLASAVTTTTLQPVVPTSPITIPSKNDGVSADGNGCAPPAGDTLPDGLWFGDLKAVSVSSNALSTGTVSLDLNCFFTGDAANKAATQDGSTDVPVPNDYYIRNKVKKVYVLPAVADVAVFKLSAMGGGPLVKAGNGAAAAAAMLAEFNNSWIGWLEVAGGQVIAIQQQFVP